MSIACPQTRIWLRKTTEFWIWSSCRSKSTTSAIKQGLRATKEVDGGRGWRRDKERMSRGNDRSRNDDSNSRPRHPTSFDEAQATRPRDRPNRQVQLSKRGDWSARRDGDWQARRSQQPGRQIREIPSQEARAPKIKKFTVAGEHPDSKEFWSAPNECHSTSEAKGALQRTRSRNRNSNAPSGMSGFRDQPRIGQIPHTPSHRPLLGEKKHPVLYKLLEEVGPLLEVVKRIPESRFSTGAGESTQELKRLLDIVTEINKRMRSGEWARRYVRGALNSLPTKIHFWDVNEERVKGKTALWIQYDNSRIALLVNGNVVEAKELPVSIPEPKENRMFSIAPPPPSQPAQQNKTEAKKKLEDNIPISIPHTKAASIFLYGANTILACLKAKRRQLYKLLFQSRIIDLDPQAQGIFKLAQEAGIPFVAHQPGRLLDKISDGRPHNGVVLEASTLPIPPVMSLGVPHGENDGIPLVLGQQSREEIEVNGQPETIPISGMGGRNPFVIMLDGITDPGNIGTILRTAHFYNVDAVAISSATCASLKSAILAKASSGACEAIPILELTRPSNFAYQSAKAGWKIYAAVAPQGSIIGPSHRGKMGQGQPHLKASQLVEEMPLLKDPCILMLGSEGDGLREILKRRAHYFVSIDGGRRSKDVVDVGVDSLNVSAAGAVLIDAFVRSSQGDGKSKTPLKEVENDQRAALQEAVV